LDVILDDAATGGTAAEVWAYATRTLTQSAASVAAVVAGSALTIQRGDTTSISLTGMGSIAARTKLWFTIKATKYDDDTQAQVLAEETAGLVYVAGRAPTTGETCVMTVTDAAAGNVTIVLSAAATKALTAGSDRVWDVQMLTASGVTTMTNGSATISADVTQRITQ
jgi:hypothetical protein